MELNVYIHAIRLPPPHLHMCILQCWSPRTLNLKERSCKLHPSGIRVGIMVTSNVYKPLLPDSQKVNKGFQGSGEEIPTGEQLLWLTTVTKFSDKCVPHWLETFVLWKRDWPLHRVHSSSKGQENADGEWGNRGGAFSGIPQNKAGHPALITPT